jgi:hypothetical protein
LTSFLSEDSLLGDAGDPPGRHLYAYAKGNPVIAWDPDGRWSRPYTYLATRKFDKTGFWQTVFNVSWGQFCILAKLPTYKGYLCWGEDVLVNFNWRDNHLWSVTTFWYRDKYARTNDSACVEQKLSTGTRWICTPSHGFYYQGRSGSSTSGRPCAEALAGIRSVYSINLYCSSPIAKF